MVGWITRYSERGPDTIVFSYKVNDAPAPVALLYVCKCERRHLRIADILMPTS